MSASLRHLRRFRAALRGALLCALLLPAQGFAALAFEACEGFESGLGGWTVAATGFAAADTSNATASPSSPTNSLFTRSGVVTVTSNTVDLSADTPTVLSLWIQQGGPFSGSDRPENPDILTLEYKSSTVDWTPLEVFAGSGGIGGEIFERSYQVPGAALANGFQVRFTQGQGQKDLDYWHIDNVCLMPGSASAQFTINHDGYGIHCLEETVTVNVIDSIAGTPMLSYDADVRLDTQAGFGTWTLQTGGGALTGGGANDGTATYDWPLGESEAVFRLYYPRGTPSVDIDAYQVSDSGIRDTDAEGLLVFTANGFAVTASPLANPPGVITTFAANQTAGTAFPLYVTAYGQLPGDPTCGVIETYAGSKNLKFWFEYVDPVSGTRSFTIDGASIGTNGSSAAAQSVTFTDGQASVIAKYKDVGRAQIFVKDDATGNPELANGIEGATATFVHRPARFVLTGIANAAGTVTNPPGASASGPAFIGAGQPFQVTVEARDAESSVTPNYGRETTAESVRLEPELLAPSGGQNPAIGGAFGPFANGSATGTAFTWSEVGVIELTPRVEDFDYLGAGDVAGSVSEPVGRFVPDHFAAQWTTDPMLSTTCSDGDYDGDRFTYEGEPFHYETEPVLTVTAKSASDDPTFNYTGTDFFRLSSSAWGTRSYQAPPPQALDASGASAAPAVGEASPGVGTIRFSTGPDGLKFTRSASSAPNAPFAASVSLAVTVADADAVTGTAPTFGPIPFSDGEEIRFGRVRISNAVGSENVDLPVRTVAEYYDGSAIGFRANLEDACTTGVTLAFSNHTENMLPGDTCVRDSGSPGASGAGCAAPAPLGLRFAQPPVAGDFNLRLAAPGPNKNGSVDVGSTVPAWLRYDWSTATAGDENPTGQATFGIYSGDGRQIYTREIY